MLNKEAREKLEIGVAGAAEKWSKNISDTIFEEATETIEKYRGHTLAEGFDLDRLKAIILARFYNQLAFHIQKLAEEWDDEMFRYASGKRYAE